MKKKINMDTLLKGKMRMNCNCLCDYKCCKCEVYKFNKEQQKIENKNLQIKIKGALTGSLF